ncbi:hypothetical protein Ae201684_010705 [Aphanomyces euteiches]|uniref:Uncharacterized protein n=1 Tax=Aphanomyces euteiches TaxID=100861 RepID=A0A6G0WWY7_9STRA|nr:hypothetical protein Ae201684_010705 [Aphanomyces euteiches]
MPSLDSLSRKRQPSILCLRKYHPLLCFSISSSLEYIDIQPPRHPVVNLLRFLALEQIFVSSRSGIHVCLDLPRHFQTLCKRIDPDVDLILTQRLSLRPSRAHSEIFYPMGHLVPNIWQSPFNVFARQRVPSSPDSRWTD